MQSIQSTSPKKTECCFDRAAAGREGILMSDKPPYGLAKRWLKRFEEADLTDEQLIALEQRLYDDQFDGADKWAAARVSAIAEERERCAKIAEEYVYPLAGAATGQVIARLIRSGGQQEPK